MSLMIMLEEIKKNLDKGNVSGMVLTDLSKAFDFIVHDLQLNSILMVLTISTLALLNRNLSGRTQRTKIQRMGRNYPWCPTRIYLC